jgi:hypothetical protein
MMESGGEDCLMVMACILEIMAIAILVLLKMDSSMGKVKKDMEMEITITDSLLMGSLKDMVNMNGVIVVLIKEILNKV